MPMSMMIVNTGEHGIPTDLHSYVILYKRNMTEKEREREREMENRADARSRKLSTKI